MQPRDRRSLSLLIHSGRRLPSDGQGDRLPGRFEDVDLVGEKSNEHNQNRDDKSDVPTRVTRLVKVLSLIHI